MDDEYCRKVPIIALTANAIVEARAKFFEAGMNDFAAKPIDLKDICAKIRKWLPLLLSTLLLTGCAAGDKEIKKTPKADHQYTFGAHQNYTML